jgi:transposase
MMTEQQLQGMNETALRSLARQLMSTLGEQTEVIESTQAALAAKAKEVQFKDTVIAKLSFEMATLRRAKFGRTAETLDAQQRALFEEAIDEDLAAIDVQLDAVGPKKPSQEKRQPKRTPIPDDLPRTEIFHEPQNTQCPCGCQLKRIGQDVSEKLDYTPGTFTVERHVRGKWACAQCETIIQAPVPAHVIDKGLPTAGLLAQVLVAKYADHLPLYRLEGIFARSGATLARATMADWVGVCGVQLNPLVQRLREIVLTQDILHADETPVTTLKPGEKGTLRAYLWAYSPSKHDSLKAVIYDFAKGRAGKHASDFLGDWRGKLLVDDFSGYKALFRQGVTELGCMAHARRKFYDLHQSNGSEIAAQALVIIGRLYEIERQTESMGPDERWRIRQTKAKPIMNRYRQWLTLQRQRATNGTAIAKALDYSLKRWDALARYVDDGRVAIDNNHIENRIRPVAQGRKAWLFAGSLRAGERAAAVMTLIQTAKLNGHDPYAYLKDILTRLPTHPNSRIDELLPHNWKPEVAEPADDSAPLPHLEHAAG